MDITDRGVIMREPLRSGTTPRAQAGLTEREITMWRALLELGAVSAPVLTRRTGLAETDLLTALDRLERLGYASSSAREQGTIFRPVAQEPG